MLNLGRALKDDWVQGGSWDGVCGGGGEEGEGE